MIHRYFIKISFDGTLYKGWQVQKNSPRTVQQKINEALSTILNEKIQVQGCCRTDTGVHALELIAHFDSKHLTLAGRDFSAQSDPMEYGFRNFVRNGVRLSADKSRLTCLYKFNSLLPADISINEILCVKKNADARFDARARTYQYFIHQKRNPFMQNRSCYFYGELNLKLMNKAANLLKCYDDFSAFSKVHKQTKTNVCKIYEAKWNSLPNGEGRGGASLVFTIRANRFLRGMVRMIVGTMLLLGKGKITLNDFSRIIESKDCKNAGALVPACGLYLTKVEYPKSLFA